MTRRASNALVLLPLLSLALSSPALSSSALASPANAGPAHATSKKGGDALEATVELHRPGVKAPLLSWSFLVTDQGRSSTVSDGGSKVELQVQRRGEKGRLYATVDALLDLGKAGRIKVNSYSGLELGQPTTILHKKAGTSPGAELVLTLRAPQKTP